MMSGQKQAGHTVDTHWNPGQYLKYSDHRFRPAIELLERIPVDAPKVIFDLGCGTGHITRIVADRWLSARVYGIDSSKEMLKKARKQSSAVNWVEAQIETWSPDERPDLIYSNATLHWIEGHDELFPRLVSYLRADGCLAVQMPLSWDASSHRLMRETLANGGLDGKPLGTKELRQAVARKWVEEPEIYYDLLASCTKSLDIWQTEYLHVLDGKDPVLEWVKGTGLRPILNGLDDQERKIFLAAYARHLRAAYKIRADGRTLYPFRRLFLIATV